MISQAVSVLVLTGLLMVMVGRELAPLQGKVSVLAAIAGVLITLAGISLIAFALIAGATGYIR
jgi:hypothetical protein